MRPRLFLALLALLLPTLLLADARSDVIIRERRDDDRNKIFELINTGDRTVWVKVQLDKRCQGQTNNSRKPQIREHWVSAKSRVQLARAWAQTSCRHDFRILTAEYR